MEKQLFNWVGWDIMDEGKYLFYNCTLKVAVGTFSKGMNFATIMVDYVEGKLILFIDETEHTYKLQLTVVLE